MNKRIIWLIVVGIILLSGFGIRQFYLHIQSDYWASQEQLVATATAQSQLQEVTHAEYFYGEKTIGVVIGKDASGQELLVMMDGDQLLRQFKMKNLFNIDTIKQTIRTQHPGVDFLRVSPGMKDGQYVWEMYYKLPQQNETTYHYAYYDLLQGTYIDSYQLSPRF